MLEKIYMTICDYATQDRCNGCEVNFPKGEYIFCPDCGQRVRTIAHSSIVHNAGKQDVKRH